MLILKEGNERLVQTPVSNATENQTITFVQGILLHDGTLLFDGTLSYSGNRAVHRRGVLIEEPYSKQKEWLSQQILGNYYPQVKLQNATFTNLKDNFELSFSGAFKGSLDKFAIASGNRLFLNPAIFHRETAADIPEETDRKF